MSATNSPEPEPASRLPVSVARVLSLPTTYVLMGLVILWLDYVSGPYLLFPILFVAPVALSAWFYSPRWGLALAIVLPIGRAVIAEFVDKPWPLGYTLVNTAIRILVLGFLAYFIGRSAEQSRALQAKVSGFITMCAWSRSVEFEGEWLTFEEYLRRRFGIQVSHGMSPSENAKLREQLAAEQRQRG